MSDTQTAIGIQPISLTPRAVEALNRIITEQEVDTGALHFFALQ